MVNKDNTQTERTPQNVFAKSYDIDFDILAVEMIGFDGTDLQRIKVTSEGKLKVAL